MQITNPPPLKIIRYTEHFSEHDLLFSKTALERGIDNYPTEDIKKQLLLTAAGLERVMALLDYPINITSGFRCDTLNHAVGGSKNSQHMRGEAADFTCSGFGPPHMVAWFLAQSMRILGIDQLIMEGQWVHVSFTQNPRYQALTLFEGKYLEGIV